MISTRSSRTSWLLGICLILVLTACQVNQQSDNGAPPIVSIMVEQGSEVKLIATSGTASTHAGCPDSTFLSPALENWESSSYELMFPSWDPEPFLYENTMPPFRFTVSAHDPDGLNVLYVTLGDSDGPPGQVGGDIQISDISPSWVTSELRAPTFDTIYRWRLSSPGSLAYQRTALQFSFTIDQLTVSNRLLVVARDNNLELGETVARLLPAGSCLKL